MCWTDGCGRDARAPRWCILIWDWLCERANYAKTGMRGSVAVEDRHDLLFYTLDGFDVTGRDGAPGCGAAPGAASTARHGTRGRGQAVDCGITAGLSGEMS